MKVFLKRWKKILTRSLQMGRVGVNEVSGGNISNSWHDGRMEKLNEVERRRECKKTCRNLIGIFCVRLIFIGNLEWKEGLDLCQHISSCCYWNISYECCTIRSSVGVLKDSVFSFYCRFFTEFCDCFIYFELYLHLVIYAVQLLPVSEIEKAKFNKFEIDKFETQLARAV